MIEVVQYMDKFYIVIGMKLVVYDGMIVKVIVFYKLELLEVLYIGMNGLVDDFDNYLVDGISIVFQINGVKLDNCYGIVNCENMFMVYVFKFFGDVIEYCMEWWLVDIDIWSVFQDWFILN